MIHLTPRAAMQKLVDDISSDNWHELHMLYAPDAVVRHPIARDERSLLQGRKGLKQHFERFFATGVKLRATPIHFIDTTDPELVIGSFTYHGEKGFGMEHFDLEACFIWRVRDGLILDTTDYLSPPVPPRDQTQEK
ncbi:nuclear transport factor 2 family protein [Sodalis sp. RH23]|uniref:nuclear transport factor 2 family protein n=1 Tax=unclassified Sodalis (in: enterobacteria) TaxID=2636512 RepID=UPI0039B57D91